MTLGLFGPQGANADTTAPVGTSTNRYGVGVQTWCKDSSTPGANNGTVYDAAFFNRIIGSLEYVVAQADVNASLGDTSALFRAITNVAPRPGAVTTTRGLSGGGSLAGGNITIGVNFGVLDTRYLLRGGDLGTPTGGSLENCAFPVLNQSTAGNAATATQLQTARTIAGTAFDGSANITITYGNLVGRPTLGTASAFDVGTAVSNVVQVQAGGKLPPLDGSDLTGLASGSYPPGFLAGLLVSQNATQDYLDIATGYCRSISNDANMALAAAMTKQMATTWAAGTNAGGLAAGETIPTSGTMHVWLISKADGTTDVMGNIDSVSGLSPSLPAGYVHKRRIDSRLIRASHVVNTFRVDDTCYMVAIVDYSSTAARAQALLSLSVPTGIVVRPLMTLNMQQNSAGEANVEMAPAANSAMWAYVLSSNSTGDRNIYETLGPPTNTLGQIYVTVAISSGSLLGCSITSMGWRDTLNRMG